MASGILWFTPVCGNSSIESAFWNPDVTINTDNPDFTECFQDTALAWGAFGLLWLGALIYLPLLTSRPSLHSFQATSPLNVTKLICNIIIIATCLADLVHMGMEQRSYTLSKWLVPAVYIITMVLASYTSRKEFVKGENSSGLMFCFWLILSLVNSVKLRTNIMKLVNEEPHDLFLSTTFFILYTVIIFELFIHLFPDNRALKNAWNRSSQSNEDERAPLLGSSNHRLHPQDTAQKIECPEKYASFLNRMLYVWCSKLLVYGYKRQLNTDKLWVVREQDKAEHNVKQFYDNWLKSSDNKSLTRPVIEDHEIETVIGAVPDGYTGLPRRPAKTMPKMTWQTESSVSWALVRTYGCYFSFLGIYEVFNIILTYIRPVLLDYLIEFVSTKEEYVWKGYFYAVMMLVVTILRAIVNQLHFCGKLVVGQRARSSLSSAVYRKTLLLSNSARREYSVGEIVNLMAVDAQRVSDATFFIHNLWSAPVNVIVSMYMIYGYLGPSSLPGLAALLLVIGSNFFLVSKVKKMQLILMKLKDARTKLINEVLSGIKVIKLYAWEGPFQEKISGIRIDEIQMVKTVAFYLSSTIVVFACAPVLFTVVAFTVYILTSADATLSAQVAFVTLTLVNSLSRPLAFLPNGIATSIQAFVSIRRLEKFLNQKELDHNMIDTNVKDGNVLSSQDGTFSWDTGETTVLKDIEFKVQDGSLTAVVGQVGCGKSTLLSAILGELHKVTGNLKRVGSIAYVPQEAWVRNQTLKANVLFNKEMDEKKYQRALEACALTSDLKILPAGDLTEIGEKGINLSGGQKQRVSLARAVYSDSDVYLMDDPLSAVDAHVGKHIFEQVIGQDGLLKYKTRILVTHGIAHLPKMDQIIVMKDGRISECGTYNDLITQDGPFAEFMRTYLNNLDEEEAENGDDEEINALKRELKTQLSRLSSKDESEQPSDKTSPSSPTRLKSVEAKEGIKRRHSRDKKFDKDADKGVSRGRRLIEDETAQIGGVEWTTLWAYLKTMSYAGVLVLVFFVFSTGCELGSNIWLSEWSQDIEKVNTTANQTLDPKLVEIRIGVYAALGIGSGVLTTFFTVYTAIACYNASFVLHDRLLKRITKAPMSFFDTTPVGRILNRFSQDMVTVDSAVRFTMIQMLRGISTIVTTIIAISFSAPIFLAAMLPITVVYYIMQKFYILSSNQLRRLVSVLTSPIYSHFGETITGASSIRAYQLQELFINDCDRRIDEMMRARFAAIIINRWLSIWLETLSGLVVLFAAVFAVITRSSISAGLVGLSISYALQITDRLSMFVRNAADLENNVVAVERIHEYSAVEQEAPWHVEGNKPEPEWPAQGHISVKDYSTRYRPGLELILKSINFDVDGGEKVGIVGRTGAGKSSMTLSLFRIIEAAEGNIIIDDIVTSKIGLHDLRTKLTIIPQDPVLFSGTLRFNLDPFNTKTENEIYDALELAHLKAFVLTLPEKLEFDCAEGGTNISVGQRQLVCLARALLRKTKVLVLDEATAAVDLETDELIQKTIRTEFNDCTVITIAHRINTVLDYDRIMVMKMGKIEEFDTPLNLMNNKDSEFYSMCKDAGIA